MPRDFFDPPPDEIDVVLIDEQTLAQAALLIVSCEACMPEDAEFPFDCVLDYLTGRKGSCTDYVLQTPAKCPNCHRDILERTLVNPEWTDERSASINDSCKKRRSWYCHKPCGIGSIWRVHGCDLQKRVHHESDL